MLSYDGRLVVAYSLDTGKILHTYDTSFDWHLNNYEISPDGKTITLYDTNYEQREVILDRSTGMVIDAKTIAKRRAQDIQFSADRRFLVVGGYWIDIYDAQAGPGLKWLAYIPRDNYTWRFIDASTPELSYTKTGKWRLYDLNAKAFR